MSILTKNEDRPIRHEVLRILNDHLIPWSQGTASSLVWMKPPWRRYPGVSIQEQHLPLLDTAGRQQFGVLSAWPKEKMVAGRYPCLCCVVEGEIDWIIGITEHMAREIPPLNPQIGRYTFRVPPRTFLVVPPGIPHDDGTEPHWTSHDKRIPDSCLCWITAQPTGAVVHMCHTSNGKHTRVHGILVKDSHLLTNMELLMDDLQTRPDAPHGTSRQYLVTMLLRLKHALEQNSVIFSEKGATTSQDSDSRTRLSSQEAMVQNACHYIHAHLLEPLTVETIAAHCYVSPSHLNRLFRRELQMSPMNYVEKQRMETAGSLLKETNMSIFEVSDYLGYKHPDIFRRAFNRQYGLSPSLFRNEEPGGASLTSTQNERIV